MRLSVAMTTHNSERYLEPLLASLLRQTCPPDELVVHDDASGDGTVAMLEAFASRAPFEVRLERAPVRRGYVDGFLRAAELCRGDLVAFCDADDVWLDRKLELCVAALERSDAQLALHAVRVVDAELRDIAPPWPAIERSRLVPPLGITGLAVDAPGMAMVFRSRVLAVGDLASRPPSRYDPSRRMLHDELTLFMAGVLGPVQLVAEPLVLYRQHGANASGLPARDARTTFEPALDDYRKAAAHCSACADYLDATAAAVPDLAGPLAAGARHYRQAAAGWATRLDLYAAPDRLARLRAVTRLVASRAYRGREAGGFGRAALGKDVVGGVALKAGARSAVASQRAGR